MNGLIAIDMSLLDTAEKLRTVSTKYDISLHKNIYSHSILLIDKSIYEIRKLDGCFVVRPLRMYTMCKSDMERILSYVRALLEQTKLPPASINKMGYVVLMYLPTNISVNIVSEIPMFNHTKTVQKDILGGMFTYEHMEFEHHISLTADFEMSAPPISVVTPSTFAFPLPTPTPPPLSTPTPPSPAPVPTPAPVSTTTTTFTSQPQTQTQQPFTSTFQPPTFGGGFTSTFTPTSNQFKNPFTLSK